MADKVSPWLDILHPQLVKRARRVREYERYYSGDHPLPFLTQAHAAKMKDEFRRMLEESRTNFMGLLIDVVDERLSVEGIRLSANTDNATDKKTWDIWQANGLDSLSRIAIQESLIKGVSYISVWEDADKDGYVDISVEDAAQCIVAYTPGTNFRQRDAALKLWPDAVNERERANIFLPDKILKYERPLKVSRSWMGSFGKGVSPLTSNKSTAWRLVTDEVPEVENNLGVVPFIPIRNKGRLGVEGVSEIADVLHVQNQINGFTFLMALAGYFGAHKQRWATGLTLMEDEETGEVLEPFDVAIDKLLVSESGDTKFGEFGQTDLDGYIKAIDQKLTHLAIATRTPKHILLPSGQDPSGDAIKSSESGLIRRVERKQSATGEALEEVMRLARRIQFGSETPVDTEIVWTDPETRSEAAVSDSVIKKFQAGLISHEQALEDMGYSQTQITRIMRTKASDALLSSITAPATAPAKTNG